MAEPICNLVSWLFYDKLLKVSADASSDKEWLQARKLDNLPQIGSTPIYVRTIYQEGTSAKPGWYRLDSRDFICQTTKRLATVRRQEDILVVTPFRAQRYRIKKQLREMGLERVSVSTVHRAQGSERHTVIFDPVRGGCSWMMSDEGERLITVALSRAKARLIVTLSRGDRQNPILDMIPTLSGYGKA